MRLSIGHCASQLESSGFKTAGFWVSEQIQYAGYTQWGHRTQQVVLLCPHWADKQTGNVWFWVTGLSEKHACHHVLYSQFYSFMSSCIIRLFQNVLHICHFIQTDILWSLSNSCDVFIYIFFKLHLLLFCLKPYLVGRFCGLVRQRLWANTTTMLAITISFFKEHKFNQDLKFALLGCAYMDYKY